MVDGKPMVMELDTGAAVSIRDEVMRHNSTENFPQKNCVLVCVVCMCVSCEKNSVCVCVCMYVCV